MAGTGVKVRCRGYKKDGSPCGKNTTDPTGYCRWHKGNPGSPKSLRESKTKSTIPDFWSDSNADAFGAKLDDISRPWEGESVSASGSFERPELEGKTASNWRVPEVKAAARRYAVSQRHLKQLTGNMKNIQGIVNERLQNKEGGTIKAGQHVFTENGAPRITLDIKETKGNFSEKGFDALMRTKGFEKSDLADYATTDVDTRKLPSELKKPPYYNASERVNIVADFEEGSSIDGKYADLYDSEKLQHWPTGRLVEEYQSMEDIHNEYKNLLKADEDYLKKSLPDGSYSDTHSDYGVVDIDVETKMGTGRWDKKAVNSYYEGRDDMPTKRVFTAKSVQDADKRNGTSYYNELRESNIKPTWGSIDYV